MRANEGDITRGKVIAVFLVIYETRELKRYKRKHRDAGKYAVKAKASK